LRRIKPYSIQVILLMIMMLVWLPLAAQADTSAVERVRAIVNQQYVEAVPPAVADADSIDGILQALGDPYAQYFTLEEFEQFQAALDQTFVGIGIVFDLCPQGAVIKSVIASSPAEQAGLISGDIIQSVNRISLVGKSGVQVGELIGGSAGTHINLQVKRSHTLLQLSITRQAIDLPSVSSRLLANRIGYIDINAFSSDTGQQFAEAATALHKQGALSWIIDLRDNGGGYLEAARWIAGYFIPGQTCLLTDNRYTSSHPLKAAQPDLLLSDAVVILVNEQTASASEVLAGALQDYHKAIIIGQPTFGKGSVQWLFNLGDDGILKLTCEKYRTPLGRTVNQVGITPDLVITGDSLKMAELVLSGQNLSHQLLKKTSVVITGRSYPISLSVANSLAYRHIYRELIQLTNYSAKIAQTEL